MSRLITVVCRHNQARSVMAAAALPRYFPNVEVASAGIAALEGQRIPQSILNLADAWGLEVQDVVSHALQDAQERLLDVNHWRKYSAITGLDFKLTDSHGKVLNRKAHKGDHIRIEIQTDAAVFDWVAIEAIEYDDYPDIDMETFAMRVRPGEHPANKKDDHILNEATTTIVIERRGKTLAASYHGRNEENNATQWLGLSDTEWAAIVKGLID